HAQHAYVAGLRVHLDLDELRAERGDRCLVGIWTAAPLAGDPHFAESVADIGESNRPLRVIDPGDDAVARVELLRFGVEHRGGRLEQAATRVDGRHAHRRAYRRGGHRAPRVAGVGQRAGIA